MSRIVVSNVSKIYKHYPTRWSRLVEWIAPVSKPRHEEIKVLENISFSIEPGEATALVGVNGAGKSTLLKMIAGIIKPSTGIISVNGSIAAILELGMGFHLEYSGRQNIYLAGQLLGLTTDQITDLMPDIEEFAGIGTYIDEPLRTYSSGMQVRLAFSLATAVRPDILIIDEALSVGDARFQHKSFSRIQAFKEQGTTLLIVSHDRKTIQSICDKAILIANGKLEKVGKTELVMDYYNAMLADREASTIRQTEIAAGVTQTISGTGEASLKEIYLLDIAGNRLTDIEVGSRVSLVITTQANQDLDSLVLGFMIKDPLGQVIYGINTHRLHSTLKNVKKGNSHTFQFDFYLNIGVGNYSVATSLSPGNSHLEKNYEWRDQSMIFHVRNSSREDFVGCTWLNPKLKIEEIKQSDTLPVKPD